MATFDARPVIAVGGEYFNDIMTTVAALDEDEDEDEDEDDEDEDEDEDEEEEEEEEELVVLAPFEPVPLEGVLSSQGFSSDAVRLGDGELAGHVPPRLMNGAASDAAGQVPQAAVGRAGRIGPAKAPGC